MSIVVASRLAELESVIERGLTTFVEVGTALMEIRDSRLYRSTHATFDDYCSSNVAEALHQEYNKRRPDDPLGPLTIGGKKRGPRGRR